MNTQHLVPIGTTRDEGVRGALGGITRPTIYKLIAAGELKSVHIGRRHFVTAASLAAYVDRLAA